MARKTMLAVVSLLSIAALAACFQGSSASRPSAQVEKQIEVSLAPANEPGEKIAIYGQVLDYQGKPLPKAAMVIYNTDKDGYYNSPNSRDRIPRIRGACVTNADGWFRISTIKPGGYPNATAPAHIHFEVVAPAHQMRHMEVWFEDDPRVTASARRDAATHGTVIVALKKTGDVAEARVDIKLEDN